MCTRVHADKFLSPFYAGTHMLYVLVYRKKLKGFGYMNNWPIQLAKYLEASIEYWVSVHCPI